MYPHSITGVLSTGRRSVIRRNAAFLPAYSFLLGLLALLGFAAIAAGVKVDNPQLSVPSLFDQEFPQWFAGVAFAAIAIGALVPAAIMSIAAANLWTRNVYREFINPHATPAQEARQSKLMSLLVKFGALVFILGLPGEFAINLQLLGGVWILQTLPAIVIGLYTRWAHRWALLAGWAVGMAYGTWTAYRVPRVGVAGSHFGGPLATVPFTDTKGYIALTTLVINLLVVVLATLVLRALHTDEGHDHTRPSDYTADAGDPGVEDIPLEAVAGQDVARGTP
jgi:SSS family solute:Na+ symporter